MGWTNARATRITAGVAASALVVGLGALTAPAASAADASVTTKTVFRAVVGQWMNDPRISADNARYAIDRDVTEVVFTLPDDLLDLDSTELDVSAEAWTKQGDFVELFWETVEVVDGTFTVPLAELPDVWDDLHGGVMISATSPFLSPADVPADAGASYAVQLDRRSDDGSESSTFTFDLDPASAAVYLASTYLEPNGGRKVLTTGDLITVDFDASLDQSPILGLERTDDTAAEGGVWSDERSFTDDVTLDGSTATFDTSGMPRSLAKASFQQITVQLAYYGENEVGGTVAEQISVDFPNWLVRPTIEPYAKSPKPTITGATKVGKTLKAVVSGWSPRPEKIIYQWLRNNRPIPGATKSYFTPRKSDAGQRISVQVKVSGIGQVTTTRTSTAKVIAKASKKK